MFKVISSSPTFGKFSNDPVELLRSNNCEISTLSTEITSNEILFGDSLKDADALIVGVEKVTKSVIERAINLKVIAKHGAGVDNIDLEAAREQGIIVTNAPGANRHAVADLVFGLILSAARQIPSSFEMIKNQQWPRVVGTEIYNKTLGIIGTGRIGKEVIKRAKGFSMRVLAYDLYPDKTLENDKDFKYTTLYQLLEQADFITIHTDLNEQSRALIGNEEFEIMKNNAFIINTARGGIIDEKALYDALSSEKIKGAALDVFEKEPFHESPLLQLRNFVATPHMAGYTNEALREVGMITARNIINILNKKTAEFEVVR